MALPTITADQADALTRAGAMVTSYNRPRWFSLVRQYGLPSVLDEVEAQAMDLRRACHAAEASAALAKAFPLVKSTPGDDRDDDQVEAPLDAPAPRPAPPLPVLSVVDQEADEVGAADTSPAASTVPVAAPIADPIPPTPAATPPHEDAPMPSETHLSAKAIAELFREVETERTRRGLTVASSMEESGFSGTAYYNFRKGVMSPAAADKLRAWLATSAKKPASAQDAASAGPPASRATSKAAAPTAPPAPSGAVKPYGREVKPVAIGDPSTLSAAELLAGADAFAADLEAFGAAPKAALVKELMRRIGGALVSLDSIA